MTTSLRALRRKIAAVWLVLVGLGIAVFSLGAAELREGRVTQIFNDVKLLPSEAAARQAAVNDLVRSGTAVRTGVDSRSELTFQDLTIARLGANSIFTVEGGTRTINLDNGAILLRVPKDSGGAKISTAAVTAAITGTTIMAEYHRDLYKFVMLEGTAKICRVREFRPKGAPPVTEEERRRRSEDCVELHAGQMLSGRLGEPLGQPEEVDLRLLTSTSQLIQGFGPLGSEDLIAAAIAAQQGTVLALNNVQDPTGLDARDQTAATNSPTPSPTPQPSVTPTPSPTATPTPSVTPSPSPSVTPSPSPSASPTPSPSPSTSPTPQKFGTPPTITSPNLSVIDSGTVINTDPTITRNGETGFGVLYRGSDEDGPPSQYFFGSTSAFDQHTGFDDLISDDAAFPIATFKFSTLSLLDNPTIITDDGATSLALIAIGEIASDIGGGEEGALAHVLTFAGIDHLLLATVNGSILLLPDISFSGIDHLFFYARGGSSNLLLGAAISGADDISAYAEHNVTVDSNIAVNAFHAFAGGDFIYNSGLVRADRFNITADGTLNFATDAFVSLHEGGATLVQLSGETVNISVGKSAGALGDALNVLVNGTTAINLLADEPTTLQFNPDAHPTFTAGFGGLNAPNIDFLGNNMMLTSGGDIEINSFDVPTVGGARTLSGSAVALGSFTAHASVLMSDLTAGTSILIGGDILADTITAGTTIDVGGELSAFDRVAAGGDVTADRVAVPNLITPGTLFAGAGGIHPFVVTFEDQINPPPDPGDGANLQHTFDVDTIVSPNGIDFSGNQFHGISGLSSGGRLTINANTIRFDAEVGIGDVNFNGADALAFDEATPARGGDGGTFIVNAVGDIFVGSQIMATTGLNDPNNPDAFFGGRGGTVTLDSADGMVTVQDRILVSSDDIADGPHGLVPVRESASGGLINIHSGLTSGSAILLTSDSSLLSFLNNDAPGPGGTISVISEGGDIVANGQITAERGTIIISNGGIPMIGPLAPFGGSNVTLDGAFLRAETINVLSTGDLNVGLVNPTGIGAVTISLEAFNILNGGNFFSGGGEAGDVTAVESRGDVNLAAGSSMFFDSISIGRRNGGVGSGVNIGVIAGNDLSVTNLLVLHTDATGLNNGGNITVSSGGDMELGGPVFLASESNGMPGDGASIFLSAGGTLTAGQLSTSVFLSGANGSGGNIAFEANQDATIDALSLDVELARFATLGSGANINALFRQSLTANSLDAHVHLDGMINQGGSILFDVANALFLNGDANFTISLPATLQHSHPSGLPPVGIIQVNAGSISVGFDGPQGTFTGTLNAYVDDSGFGMPTGLVDSVFVHSDGPITVANRLNVLGSVHAGGNITAETISSTDVSSDTAILALNGGITRFSVGDGPPVSVLHTLTAPMVTSRGGINFNGLDTAEGFGDTISGGSLTINANSLSFDVEIGDIRGPVTFNAGANNLGHGGVFTVNTTGAILVNSPIEATTGLIDDSLPPMGAGGTVTLNSSNDTVTVNRRIEVSSNDPQTGPTPRPPSRRSAAGGTINISSGKKGTQAGRVVAIDVSNSGQLLSLLAAAPTPRPGGKIVIKATGADSDVHIAGRVEAQGGLVDIRHNGARGNIDLNGTVGNGSLGTLNIAGDVVKVAALGTNGVLKIQGGRISADTTLQLYATGFNGEVRFMGNVSLDGTSVKSIAGNSVRIDNGVLVNIDQRGPAANVFVNNNPTTGAPNAFYTGFGGNGQTTGTFTGAGANPPRPLNQAPPLGPPPGG
jgi:hypothetical protein